MDGAHFCLARTCYVTRKYAESLWKETVLKQGMSKKGSHSMDNSWKMAALLLPLPLLLFLLQITLKVTPEMGSWSLLTGHTSWKAVIANPASSSLIRNSPLQPYVIFLPFLGKTMVMARASSLEFPQSERATATSLRTPDSSIINPQGRCHSIQRQWTCLWLGSLFL